MAECTKAQQNKPTAVALGFFDGLHLGHRAVIDRAVAEAGDTLVPAAFTFSIGQDAPRKKKGAAALSTPEEKLELLRQAGAVRVENPDFASFQGMTPEEFVGDFLAGQMGAKVVCCGSDFRFGKGAAAGVEDLMKLGEPYGIRVCVVPAVMMDGQPVSSTRIRAAIACGNMAEAARLLGRPYSFAAPVVQGKQLGRKLGFPTVNQQLPVGLSLPPVGVYAARIQTPDGVWRMGVCNIGAQPTVEGTVPLAETYILDFAGDLYGQTLRLAPWHKLRDIEKFDSVEQLRETVLRNADEARAILTGQNW
ncbi:MAG: riboflavin biosynthesis protein RibF [Oscillospiraceae bacterium]|nr:riboflavin biosynthesis protein RibF [Oscillospiraceae bacterium]